MEKKVAVLGGGSFGTVLANIAASNGNEVALWVRDADQALRINSEGANSTYHPELQLSNNITASDNLHTVIKDSTIVLIATPSIVFETIVKRIAPLIDNKIDVISCTKGIRHNPFRTMSNIIEENLSFKNINVGVLSGPNLAREIADNKIAGTVIASTSQELIDNTKLTLSSDTFKVYSSSDVNGIELAGALKNIYAIICGLASSLDVGENANGLILTRSMAEMSRFAVAKGANPITFLGLAGMGDLLATCTSKLSRNFQLGVNIGKGLSIDAAKDKVGQVAEGIRTLEVAHEEAAKHDINMPLMESLYKIIYENKNPESLLDDLINHPHEIDVEFTQRGK
ncbi:NAD(P)-dependent glycerol-3-phosphate dehydrogenase [Gammaproteobacteria bacterium]|nr:NAD(P)-dependent glycerol-3-phosphate dehydrogenase [Gammaproteobacteria bacterium]MDA9112938.1 NAD(P)-dependent glycerol-3-phosphate dehydrogenase [Gammaproteobacteria bacterium]MDB4059755.1 NAD(P)-dependent glycerol-3-phosphate dehydrogenase [Gammaproteobacteria bacterium]MDB9861451.1 NAD(P)-dependent glycerol-3-phosphate dehydrogenase [Gammaproteobacteria bacterium]MDC1191202.1 NAD(P)-dependent glycerol-3-phosphate dehydrogenase [Gammaproteobacteria bacterium]